MGTCCSSTTTAEEEMIKETKRTDAEIGGYMKHSKTTAHNNKKILLLGAGDTGKSTIMKQIRRAHIEEIPNEELEAAANHVRVQICRSLDSIMPESLSDRPSMSSHYEEEKDEPSYPMSPTSLDICHRLRVNLSRALSANERHQPVQFTPEFVKAMSDFWETDVATQCFADRSSTKCMDTLPYFMANLDSIALPSYVPSVDDFLRVRIPTVGVRSHTLKYHSGAQEDQTIQFIDVGGQRNERKKWIHVFDDVASVLWIVSLSEYDQVLHEARDRSRYEESLALFQQTVSNPAFINTSFVCFLNKKDIFEEKIGRTPFNVKSYEGDRYNPEEVIGFIRSQYETIFSTHRGSESSRISFHVTCATDFNMINAISGQVVADLFVRAIRSGTLV